MAHLIDPCNPLTDLGQWVETEEVAEVSEVHQIEEPSTPESRPRIRQGLVDGARFHECGTGVDRLEAEESAQLAARIPVSHRLPASSLPNAPPPPKPLSAAPSRVLPARPAQPDFDADAIDQTRHFKPQRFHRSGHMVSGARSLRSGMPPPVYSAGMRSPGGDISASTGDLCVRLRWPRKPDHYSMHVLSQSVEKPSFHTQKSWRQLTCPGSAVASSKRKVYDRVAAPILSDLPSSPHSAQRSPCASPGASSTGWRRASPGASGEGWRRRSRPPEPTPLRVSWDAEGVSDRELREQRGTNLGEAYPAPGEGNFQGMAGQQCPELFKIMTLKPQRVALSMETGYRARMKALFPDWEPGKGG